MYGGADFKYKTTKKTHENAISKIKYSPDGSKFVSVCESGKMVLYDGITGEVIKEDAEKHGRISIVSVSWINNQKFATAIYNKISLWNLNFELLR